MVRGSTVLALETVARLSIHLSLFLELLASLSLSYRRGHEARAIARSRAR